MAAREFVKDRDGIFHGIDKSTFNAIDATLSKLDLLLKTLDDCSQEMQEDKRSEVRFLRSKPPYAANQGSSPPTSLWKTITRPNLSKF